MSDTGWKWGDGPPREGSAEARRRIKEAGVPLDEWGTINGTSAQREAAEYKRKSDFVLKFWIGVAVAIIAALLVMASFGSNGGVDDPAYPDPGVEYGTPSPQSPYP